MKRGWMWLMCAAVFASGCTDATLAALPRNALDVISLQGQVCSRRPEKSTMKVRVLFVVDASDGIQFSDPGDLYVEAIAQTVARFRDEPTVSFGIERFGQSVRREFADLNNPVLFTNDHTLLASAFARMRLPVVQNPVKYLGGTDYTLGLRGAQTYITDDLAANPPNNVTYKYIVAFITAGQPQSSTKNPVDTVNEILAAQGDLIAAHTNVRFDVYSIFKVQTVPPEFETLLATMAKNGGGNHVQMNAPDELDANLGKILTTSITYTQFDMARLLLAEDVKSITVYNRNQLIAKVADKIDSYIDSDGDGLADAFETLKGYNPRAYDTDFDGLDDFFEDTFANIFDPTIAASPALTSDDLADPDHDGLNNFIEHLVKTDARLADTDADGIADDIEFRFGNDPTVADLEADYDRDGRPNGFELLQHTHPRLAEPAELLAARAYSAVAVGAPNETDEGRWCYPVNVRNITIGETLSATDSQGIARPAGQNTLVISNLERPLPLSLDPVKIGSPNRLHTGRVGLINRPSQGMRDPPALILTIRSAEFEP